MKRRLQVLISPRRRIALLGFLIRTDPFSIYLSPVASLLVSLYGQLYSTIRKITSVKRDIAEIRYLEVLDLAVYNYSVFRKPTSKSFSRSVYPSIFPFSCSCLLCCSADRRTLQVRCKTRNLICPTNAEIESLVRGL